MACPGKVFTSAKELPPGEWLARGKHPHPVHPRSSVPVRGAQGFGNLPKNRPGLGETTYTTSESSLRTNRVLFPNTQVGWGSHLLREVSPPRSKYILCGLLRQAPQSTKTALSGHTISIGMLGSRTIFKSNRKLAQQQVPASQHSILITELLQPSE